ncbi:MAG: two-component system, NarL family, sensor histidine kinase DesK [Streptosporangiaceae bacterium]|nr:two-component system, NarL family, sensor histidine kinase DesK [Streptosporangiaceae bacterium]
MTEAPAQRRGQADAVTPASPSAGPAGTGQAGSGPAGIAPDGSGASPELMAVRGRWSRVGWMFAAIWLVYLAQPVTKLWSDPNLARRYLGLADLIAFAAVFVLTFAAARFLRDPRNRHLSRRIGVVVVAAEAVLVGLAYAALGSSATGLLIYVSVMAVFLLPTRVGWVVVGAFVAASLIIPWAQGWTVDGTMAFQIFVSAVAAWGVSQVIQRNAQLVEARNEITRLALAEQRNQFARDLHDILGHSLTVVAVKAELAGRLTSLDPERAGTEIADVERIARQALADVRAAAAGYREITLAGELCSARTALAAAGIEADLPGQGISSIPRPRQELFGWAVREGVTNVVRHSGATRCRIRVTASEVEISDDGCGPPAPADGTAHPAGDCDRWPAHHLGTPAGGCGPASGHGLAGLRERAAGAGATVSVGRSAAGGFALRVRVS